MQIEESKTRIKEKLRREAGGHIMAALSDDSVVEILLNHDGSLWIERLGSGMNFAAKMEGSVAESLIATVASYTGLIANRENPVLECEFPLDGSRFEAVLPPIVEKPIFSLRKRALRTHTLSDYVREGVMSDAQRSEILEAITNRLNILVIGGTSTGKTTLANGILDAIVQICPDHRLVILEDTREIQCHAKNFVQLKTSETKTMNQLLRATLRLRPDRIIVGEVRGSEALSLLKAWNTGHPGGIATLHANDAHAGLVRLEQLVAEALVEGAGRNMPKFISEAVDLLIVIAKVNGSRKISEIAKVEGFDGENYKLIMR
ncbi:MAG: P-type conjugative transfer ATPase TrbB [Proteobacteria bacterium]|nr:MAG: P-type conjugative transfer ATPase TrbB [Pseudomonadota bacterium]